ncbi:GDP-mannose 4,6-dehydratase [Spiribacter insolitus]|uniref:GDP-mannose 4,6-dehydratase n=1 Tax=Spiribacter insolitus TaxID=3122417 RepID=A0ABV3T3M2_9GAMM
MGDSSRRAIVTGAAGQDGSYLCELLLEKGYEVHGITRETTENPKAGGQQSAIVWHPGGLGDQGRLDDLLEQVAPREIYHLAAASHVAKSFDNPWAVTEAIGGNTVRLLEAMRSVCPDARLFHASSAEIFGNPDQSPQNENTPLAPISPYGAAKTFSTHMVRIYRQAYGLFGVNGILYNHESVRRGGDFVTRKICRGAATISLGQQENLHLGNIEAARDWGYAPDYVRGMWTSLQHDKPMDYIMATGRLHRVKDVLEAAFSLLNLDWREHVVIDEDLFRPTEPTRLIGDASRARQTLGWQAETRFETFIQEMTESELEKLSDSPNQEDHS